MKNSLNSHTARISPTLEALIAEEKAEKKAAKANKAAEAEKAATAYKGSYAEYKANEAAPREARDAALHARIDAGFAAKSEPEFRTTNDSFYGAGRVYAGTSGATHYMGSDGKYSTQIWDQD